MDDPTQRRVVVIELVLLLGATLGYSAVRAVLSLTDMLLQGALAGQSTALNTSQAEVGLVDLFSQLAIYGRDFCFGALGLLLLWRTGIRLRAIGLDRLHAWRDVGVGTLLTAVIGIPGIALYLGARALGISVEVQASALDQSWWQVPALILSAFANGWVEETIVVAYVLTRTRQLGWSENAGLVFSAVLRGAYHLYQGFGGFIGNLVMGLVFGRLWQRTNRLWPLIITHTLLDVFAFVGYALLAPFLPFLS